MSAVARRALALGLQAHRAVTYTGATQGSVQVSWEGRRARNPGV